MTAVNNARQVLLQAKDDHLSAVLEAENQRWRRAHPCKFWPDAEAQSVQAEALEAAARQRVAEATEHLHALGVEDDLQDAELSR